MSKALLQEHAAKALRDIADQQQKQIADNEQARLVQQQAQYVQQQVLQVQQAQHALQVQQAELDLRAQTITQVNIDNAALREEVDRLIVELNDYDTAAAAAAACEDTTIEVTELISPLLPAYSDSSVQHGFEDYEEIGTTGECKE